MQGQNPWAPPSQQRERMVHIFVIFWLWLINKLANTVVIQLYYTSGIKAAHTRHD
jgi:hypothetical protein